MPELHMYVTAILAFFLTLLGGATGWLMLTVISNQSRIAVLESAISNVGVQLGDIKTAIGKLDGEMNEGLKNIHARISAVQGKV